MFYWKIELCVWDACHMHTRTRNGRPCDTRTSKIKYLIAITKVPLDRASVKLSFDMKIKCLKQTSWPDVSVQLLSCFCLPPSLNFAQISNRHRIRQRLTPTFSNISPPVADSVTYQLFSAYITLAQLSTESALVLSLEYHSKNCCYRLAVDSVILARPIGRPSQPFNHLNLFPCFSHDIQQKELTNEEDRQTVQTTNNSVVVNCHAFMFADSAFFATQGQGLTNKVKVSLVPRPHPLQGKGSGDI